MTSFDANVNFGYSRVLAIISQESGVVIFTVETGDGVNFVVGQNITIWPAPPALPTRSNAMIVRITAKTGDQITASYPAESSATISVAPGMQVASGVTKAKLDAIQDAINAIETTIGSISFPSLPITIANGGTGQTSAANARTALGLAIGTNVQAWSANLDGWAALTPTVGASDNNFINNGKIVTSIVSNDLVVAIKTLAGADPSVGDPVDIRIGNVKRSITSALSVTLADATNWMDAGSPQTLDEEIDYFAFLTWSTNGTPRVVLSVSRLPYGRIVSDFNATTTHGKGIVHSGAVNSTDELENIGRFNAILSGSPSYAWSAASPSIIINKPCFETRLLIYNPEVFEATLGNGSITGNYQIINDRIRMFGKFTFGSTSAITGNFYLKPVIASISGIDEQQRGSSLVWDDSIPARYTGSLILTVGNLYPLYGTGAYGYFTSSNPITWATGDFASWDITMNI